MSSKGPELAIATLMTVAVLVAATPAVADAPQAAQDQAAAGGSTQPVEITFLANEGVLIGTAGKKILVDALFRTPNPAYAAPPSEVLEKLETGAPPFDNVALILATHNHPDHFDPVSVIRCLRHNSEAVFLSTAEAKAAMQAVDEDLSDLKDRIVALSLAPLEVAEHSIAGIEVRALRTLHSRSRETPHNLMFLLTVGSRTIFHEGDSEGVPEIFAKLELSKEEIHVALVHFWFAFTEQGHEILNKHLDPDQIVLIHTPVADVEKYRTFVAEHPEELPNVTILTEAMQQLVF